MKMKLFTVHDIVYDRTKHSLSYRSNDDGSVFGLSANGFRKTKVLEERLKGNPDYVHGRFYKRWGYLNVKDIKHVKYAPIHHPHNHVFRDDALLVSYDKPIVRDEAHGYLIDGYVYDIAVFGNEILSVLLALRDRFDWNIDEVKEEMWQKCLTLKTVNSFSHDNYFDEAVKSREHFDRWFLGNSGRRGNKKGE